MLSRSLLLASLLALSATVLAEELAATDVPAPCSTICKPVTDLTSICDTDPNGSTLGGSTNNMPASMPGMPMRARYVMTNEMDANKLSGKNLKVTREEANKVEARYVMGAALDRNDLSGKNLKLSARQMMKDESIGKACVCQNKSFKVEEVAGMCAGCMQQNGAKMDEMDRILSACNFKQAAYSPAMDAMVANVKVEAMKPDPIMAANRPGAPVMTALAVSDPNSFPATATESRFSIPMSTMTMMATGTMAPTTGTGAGQAAGNEASSGAMASQTATTGMKNAAAGGKLTIREGLGMPAALAIIAVAMW